MVVVDIGSLATREEQALVAESVLGHLWERRTRREPVLLVIDEAHNVCPREPADALTALATEHAVRIAGEGRKFGIYMLVASQRPAKVHENVLSQCDNLVLMRLNSAADAALIADLYGFVPPALVSLATDFRLGEALVAGKLASHPMVMRFGARSRARAGRTSPPIGRRPAPSDRPTARGLSAFSARSRRDLRRDAQRDRMDNPTSSAAGVDRPPQHPTPRVAGCRRGLRTTAAVRCPALRGR